MKAGDIVRIKSTTEHMGEQKEFIPIGTFCRVLEVDGKSASVVPYSMITGNEVEFWYLQTELEEMDVIVKYSKKPNIHRMTEIATQALHKLLEIDEEIAMEFFNEDLDLEETEREFFELPMDIEGNFSEDFNPCDEEEEYRGCRDCPDDECTGHCMSCMYRPV